MATLETMWHYLVKFINTSKSALIGNQERGKWAQPKFVKVTVPPVHPHSRLGCPVKRGHQ